MKKMLYARIDSKPIMKKFISKVEAFVIHQSKKPLTKKIFYTLFLLVVAINLAYAARFVLQNDLHMPSDIARDFLLMEEIETKKIVLIGARTSSGLFHGPLWLYLNYPAYVLGNGNPLVIGWYWIFLVAITLIGYFIIAKKLFNTFTACAFVLISSLYYAFHTQAFINPHGAMLVLPFFFFFFIRYIQTLNIRFLFALILMLGVIIQFQMAVGIPFTILSFLFIGVHVIRAKKYQHIIAFLFLAVPLSNFILFDIKHDFLISKKALEFTSPQSATPNLYRAMINDRVDKMTNGIEFMRGAPPHGNIIVGALCLFFFYIQRKDKKYPLIYRSFAYFFVGYFLLSFINKGFLLYFYLFPIFPLVFLIFCSFFTSRWKKAFAVIFCVCLFFSYRGINADIKQENLNRVYNNHDSWKFLYGMSKIPFEDEKKEIGYLLYSPDALSYQSRYAMKYANQTHGNKGESFVKKPVTYIIVAPLSQDNPYLSETWWIEKRAYITSKPVWTKKFDNGYRIEKYQLSEHEINTPIDPTIDTGLHFR